MTFHKRSTSQKTQHKLITLQLSSKSNSTGNYNPAVNELEDNGRRALYAIKRQCPFKNPVRIWLQILESAIEPIALYANETKAPFNKLEYENGTNV